jgi:hypothetical protein
MSRSRTLTPTSAVIAWGTWAAMLLAALLFVSHFGSNVPSWDDWDMIPVLTHHQPVTWNWLWSQHNEHRVPLPRLVFLGLDRLLGVDMRVTMYFDVLLMAAVAAAMITNATRLRGRVSAADAFFPMTLLSLGQAANWLWGWQLQFFASVAIACVALLAIVRAGATLSPTRAGLVVGLCTVLLPLCGANGLALVPALAVWPLALAILPHSWTGAKVSRGNRVMLLAVGLLALALTAIYLVGWHRVPYHPRSQSVLQTLLTALKSLTIGIGPATRDIWPLSGLLTFGVMGASVLLLVRVWRERVDERARAGGLLLFVLALSLLGLALGLGRNGFETRYVTLTLPVWCGVAFIWLLYGKPARVGIPAALAGAALVAMPGNSSFGLQYARELRGQLGGFQRDLAAGVPLHLLLHRYHSWLHPHQDVPGRYLPMLRDAGVPGYTSLREDPTMRPVPLDLRPTATVGLEWRDSTARVQSSNARLVFDLPRERFVTGLRLRYRYRSDDGNLPYIAIQWKRDNQRDFDRERYYKYSPTGDHANWKRGTWDTIHDSATTMTVWICDTVHQIAITPDFRPAYFRIDELSLLESRP